MVKIKKATPFPSLPFPDGMGLLVFGRGSFPGPRPKSRLCCFFICRKEGRKELLHRARARGIELGSN